MSVGTSVRALPTLIRVGFAEALAYRAEMLIWILATTMPLVMLALWHAVAADAPIGRFGSREFVAYFLAMFIVRQLTSSWSVWIINMEVRDGTLALRMLRPVHPLISYAASSLASIPVRGLLSIPVSCLALLVFSHQQLSRDPLIWLIWVASVFGGWLLTLTVNLAIGCLALFMESSLKIMEIWLALYFVFSGYLVPIELFPPAFRAVIEWLPFRYQLGFQVELMTGLLDRTQALNLLARQAGLVVAGFALVAIAWQTGVKRFAAFGG